MSRRLFYACATGERDGTGGGWLWAGSRRLELPPMERRASWWPVLLALVVAAVLARGCAPEMEPVPAVATVGRP